MSQFIVVIGAGGVGAETLKLLSKTTHRVRVIDRDFVEDDTLKRQTLYRKADLGRLKADVAARKLGPHFEGVSEHLGSDNVNKLLQGADAVLDCTDNWATRAVINQWALRHKKPWIFTSAIRDETMTTTLTQKTACFICWSPKPQQPRSCRIEGITKATTALAAQTQVEELETLMKGKPTLAARLQYSDTKTMTCSTTPLSKNPQCLACVKKTFRLPESKTQTLCGSDEYLFQLDGAADFRSLSSLKTRKFGDVLKIRVKTGELVVFQSGRILARGMTEKQAMAAVDALRQKIAS